MDFIALGKAALAVLGAVIAVLVVVAPLTKTDADNRVLAKLQSVARVLGELLAKLLPSKQK